MTDPPQPRRSSGRPAQRTFDEALLLGVGSSNQVWSQPHSDLVYRTSFAATDALDLRLLGGDAVVRAALLHRYPSVYTAAVAEGRPALSTTQRVRLTPLPEITSEREHDERLTELITELGRLSHHSAAATRNLVPEQRATLAALVSLPAHEHPLACGLDTSDSAVMRAFTLRVAAVVRATLGPKLCEAFNLPSVKWLDEHLPRSFTDHSPLVVAHGDPTVGNLMTDGIGELDLIDYDLARVAPQVSAAAQTWAALETRAGEWIRPEREKQFREEVAGAEQALGAGLNEVYLAYEIARSQFVDAFRTANGDVSVEILHRNLARGQGDRTPGRRRLADAIAREGGRKVPVPHISGIGASEMLAMMSGRRIEDHHTLVAIAENVVGNPADLMPPEARRAYETMLDIAGPPGEDTILDNAWRLVEEGRTRAVVSRHPDRLSIEFSRPYGDHGPGIVTEPPEPSREPTRPSAKRRTPTTPAPRPSPGGTPALDAALSRGVPPMRAVEGKAAAGRGWASNPPHAGAGSGHGNGPTAEHAKGIELKLSASLDKR